MPFRVSAVAAAAAALVAAGQAPARVDGPAHAEAAQACTAKQKQQRTKALAAYRKAMARQRAAYFRTYPSRKLRAAFVKRQQARLKALQRSLAACSQRPKADLTVSVTATGGNQVTYTVAVRNAGPAAAARVQLLDELPAAVTFASVATSAGTCSAGPRVACSLGTIASRRTVTVTIVAWVRGGPVTNAASATSSTAETSLRNNTGQVVYSPPALPPPSTGPACSPALTPGPVNYFFHLGPTDYTKYVRPSGPLGVLVLFVDFPDAPGSEPTQPLFEGLAPSAVQWYRDGSYGRFTPAARAHNAWLRLPKSAASYDLDYRGDFAGIVARNRAYLADAVAAADAQVDFSQVGVVAIVPPAGATMTHTLGYAMTAGNGVVADGTEIRGAMTIAPGARTQPGVFVHELGHVFGLPDMYDFSVPYDEGIRPLGRWEPMSRAGSLSHFLGWVKWKLGWLDPAELRCLDGPGTLEETVTAGEAAGGVKAIVLPRSTSTADVVEVHTLRGASNDVCDAGVIVYSVDVAAPSGVPGARLRVAQPDADPGTVGRCGPQYRAAFDLGPGEVSAYEDAGVRVEVLATDGGNFRVRVTRK